MSYLNVGEVDTAVVNLSSAYPSITQLITLPHATFEGRTSHALRIGAGAAGSRDVVMAIGGQHAREWGSCEILIGFAADLLEAYQTSAGLVYGGKSFTVAQVQGIVDDLHVVVFPLVNPDGRNYSQSSPAVNINMWRRNRNPAYSGGSPSCVGVDLNRNYDFLFDYKNKFHPDTYSSPTNPYPIQVSDDPCDAPQRYHGPSPFSEPETQNVRWLLDMFPRTRWFFDVHSYTEKILHNWGDDDNQSTDSEMNFRNPAYDSQRGLKADTAYKEYIPDGDEDIERTLGEKLRDAITAVRGKVYSVNSSFTGLYPTSGTSKDYAYSRHFVDPSKARAFSYTIEWGQEFQPDWSEMELIVADITAGLIEFCTAAPCAADLVAVSLDTPSLQFIDVPAGEEAMRAVVFTVQSCDAVTFTAQPPVKTSPGPGSLGLPFGGMENLPPAPTAAPRHVYIWVSYQAPSPTDVTSGSITVHCDPLNVDYVVPITANTIPPPKVASVLVLDRSASMAWASGIPGKARIDVLHEAAPVYVELLPDDHGIGVVAFDHDPYPVKPVLQTSAGGRDEALMGIDDHQPNPMGNTAIGDGVELAHNTLVPLAGYDYKTTVVFTDGHETAAKYITEVESLIDERVFALGLGTAEQLNPVALNKLVSNTDGYLLLTGQLGTDDELRVEKYFSQIQAGVSNAQVVVDPEGSLLPGPAHRIPFTVTEADRSATVFLLSPAPWAIDFLLITPDGSSIEPEQTAALPAIEFVTGQRVRQYRMTFPVPIGAGARQGLWHAELSISKESFKKYLSDDRRDVRSAALHGLRYSLNVHAFSSVRMTVKIVQSSFVPGATLTLRAVLTESSLPIEKRAFVRADVTRPDGTTASLTLSEVEPGVFESTLAAPIAGIYPIRFRATGTTLRGWGFAREQLRTAAVWRGGDDAPPTSQPQPPDEGADWCSFLECLLQQDGVVAWLERQKVDVDELRRCMRSVCRSDERSGAEWSDRTLAARILPLLEKAIR
jgi:murein tripeptide amidase MpaA